MSLFVLILGLFSIALIVLMMIFPDFLKKPFAPMCDIVCTEKKS